MTMATTTLDPPVIVEVSERYAGMVRDLVAWLERSSESGSIRIDRRGESIKATLEVTGPADRVFEVAASLADEERA
uniref:Uncharacterized protein n=1 Tax=viral metagenome TaxID=1070528 RepID=A0A6M3J0S1_9ZZZZ